MSHPPAPADRAPRQSVWLILAAVAAFAFWQALGFGLGSRAAFGSGLVPLALSKLVLGLSVAGYLIRDPDRPEPLAARPLLGVAAGVAAFVLLVDAAGLVPAVVACMALAYLGQNRRGYPLFLLYACLFAGAACMLFAQVLNVPVGLIGPR